MSNQSALRPSPAIVVPADMQIGDAVRKMRDQSVGSLLIVREVIPHDLVGIFTERDLLRKIDEIQHGGYWEKGIASVMTRPVMTVSVLDLKRAPEMMKKHGIRHLPVVYKGQGGKEHLVGMISMRDLFLSYYDAGASSALDRARQSSPKVAVSSNDASSVDMLRTILSQNGKTDILEEKPDELIDHFKSFIEKKHPDFLILDLDFVGPARWAGFLKQVNHEENAPGCILLFTPGLHEKKNVAVLSRLSTAGRISAFAKPIDVLSFLQKLERHIEPGGQ